VARAAAALAVALALLAAAPGLAAAASNAYITVGDENAAGVAQLGLADDGALSALSPLLVGPPNGLAGVALTPNGRTAYVALNSTNPGSGPTELGTTVLQFGVDRGAGTLSPLSPPSAPSAHGPGSVAVSPDGRSVYAVSAHDDVVSQYDVDPQSGAMTPKAPASLPTGVNPADFALTPDGQSAYVTNFGDDTISQYDVDPANGALTAKPGPPPDAPGEPLGMAVTPDGRSAYAAAQAGVLQYDIDPSTGALTPKADPLVSTAIPSFVVISPNGRSAYVDEPNTNNLLQYDVGPNGLTPKSPPSVSVSNERFPVLNDVGVTPDSRHVLVLAGALATEFGFDADAGGALTPGAQPTFALPASAHRVAVAPDAPQATFIATTSGLTAGFDAGGSTDPGGTIARYDWDFGDGASARDAGPTPSHTYGAAGTYAVSLTLTSSTGCTAGSSVYVTRMAACSGAGARTRQSVTVSAPAAGGGGATTPTTTTGATATTPPGPVAVAVPGRARTSILSRSAVVTGTPPHARTQIVLRCGAASSIACRGRVRLSLASGAAARSGAAQPAALLTAGRGRFASRAGRRVRVTVRIGARAFRVLRARGRAGALVTVATRQQGRRSAVTRRTIALRFDGGRG